MASQPVQYKYYNAVSPVATAYLSGPCCCVLEVVTLQSLKASYVGSSISSLKDDILAVWLWHFNVIQATIALCMIVACGISLSNAAQRIHQFANCDCAHPGPAVQYRTWVKWYVFTLCILLLWDGVCCGKYDGLQGAGNRDYCAVITQHVSATGIRAGVAGSLLSQGARK